MIYRINVVYNGRIFGKFKAFPEEIVSEWIIHTKPAPGVMSNGNPRGIHKEYGNHKGIHFGVLDCIIKGLSRLFRLSASSVDPPKGSKRPMG